jgi:hypothetical protein
MRIVALILERLLDATGIVYKKVDLTLKMEAMN